MPVEWHRSRFFITLFKSRQKRWLRTFDHNLGGGGGALGTDTGFLKGRWLVPWDCRVNEACLKMLQFRIRT